MDFQRVESMVVSMVDKMDIQKVLLLVVMMVAMKG